MYIYVFVCVFVCVCVWLLPGVTLLDGLAQLSTLCRQRFTLGCLGLKLFCLGI